MKIINVHAHIWENEDVDARIAHYACNGMVRICVIGASKARLAIEKYPKLAVGFGIVFPGKDPVEIIDKYSAEGFAGAKFICPRAPYDCDQYLAYYERLVENRMIAAFHTGYVSDLGFDTSILWMHPMTLDRIARRFKELKIIGYHIGNPWYTDACAMALNFENVFWDLSGGTVRATPLSYLRRVFSFRTLDDVGHDVLEHQLFNEGVNTALFRKFCFGTDNPAPVYMMDFMRDLMAALNVPKDVQELVWWRNAARILGIEGEIDAL